jgi:transcription elongation factor Elf1
VVYGLGRRRRRVIRKPHRTLPRFFKCPRCGSDSVRIIKKEDENGINYTVVCGQCGLRMEAGGESVQHKEPIDVYNMFVDAFYRGDIK